MKKLFIVVILTCTAFITKAEEFKAFRVDLGLGYAIPNGGGGGVIVALEPKYSVTPQISAGIRWEGAMMARTLTLDGEKAEGELKLNSSFLITGDYHFTTNKFRPFAGIGLGAYSLAGASVSLNNSSSDVNVGAKTNFGVMGRVGFDVAHIRLAVEYYFYAISNL